MTDNVTEMTKTTMMPTANATTTSSEAAVGQASNGTTVSLPDTADEGVTMQDRRAAGSGEKLDFSPRLEAHLTLELCGSCSRMYVSVSTDQDDHFFAGEACCTPVAIDVTTSLDLSDGGNVMRVVAFNASENFTCDDISLGRRRGSPISEDLRAELSELVSRKVETEVRGALESTYSAIFEDELRDTFPRLADLTAQENSGVAPSPTPSALTSSGSRPL